jgi:hypothetical protein
LPQWRSRADLVEAAVDIDPFKGRVFSDVFLDVALD